MRKKLKIFLLIPTGEIFYAPDLYTIIAHFHSNRIDYIKDEFEELCPIDSNAVYEKENNRWLKEGIANIYGRSLNDK